MAERRTITDRERALENLRVVANKIDRLNAQQGKHILAAKAIGKDIMPLSDRLHYLLQDPVLTDEDRAQYESVWLPEADTDG